MLDMMDERRLMRELAAAMGLEEEHPRPIRKMTLTLEVGKVPILQIEELIADNSCCITQVLSKYRVVKAELTDEEYLKENGWRLHPQVLDDAGNPKWFVKVAALAKWPAKLVLKHQNIPFFSKEDAVTLQRQLEGNLF